MKKKILLVEDDPSMSLLLLMELEEAGFDPVHAEDGAQALEILAKQSFDGILSDLYMPNIDGLQLVDALAARSIDIMTIIMSGSSNAEVTLKLKQKGVEHIFIKPLHDEQLSNIFTLLASG